MPQEVLFELPRDVTRIWDLNVPIIEDKKTKTTTAFITEVIQDPHVYNELCYLLISAKPDWTFNLIINTPGGVVDSALMIVDAISNSPATVIGHLTGTVASAGTIISMMCDDLVVAPHISFMIHNYSGGMMGKGHEMKARQKFTDDQLNAAFMSFYSGFLTKKEMTSVLEGADLWMSSQEIEDRWAKRVSYLEGK